MPSPWAALTSTPCRNSSRTASRSPAIAASATGVFPEGMSPGDELFDAKFTVLGEYVKHHIKEEQREMFPRARRAKVDLADLGEQMLQRKEELA